MAQTVTRVKCRNVPHLSTLEFREGAISLEQVSSVAAFALCWDRDLQPRHLPDEDRFSTVVPRRCRFGK